MSPLAETQTLVTAHSSPQTPPRGQGVSHSHSLPSFLKSLLPPRLLGWESG